MKLQMKLTLLFSVLTVIALLVSSIAGYEYTKQQITTNIQDKMQVSVNSEVNKLDGWLAAKGKMLEITAGTIHSTIGDAGIPLSMLAGRL